MKEPIDTTNHFPVVHQFAAVGLLNTSLNSRDEVTSIFEHPANRVLYQLFRIGAVVGSNLLEPCFNVGREMHFHAPRLRVRAVCVKAPAQAAKQNCFEFQEVSFRLLPPAKLLYLQPC